MPEARRSTHGSEGGLSITVRAHGHVGRTTRTKSDDPITIGRQSDVAVRIGAAPLDPRISRLHVQISWSGESWLVENLSSSNPIEVYQLGWPPRNLDERRSGREPSSIPLVARRGELDLPAGHGPRHVVLFRIDGDDLPAPAARPKPQLWAVADPDEAVTQRHQDQIGPPTMPVRLTKAQLHAAVAYYEPYLTLPRPRPLRPRSHQEVQRDFAVTRSSLRGVLRKVQAAGGPGPDSELSEEVAFWLVRYEIVTPDQVSGAEWP
jgi:hypothetical protein